MTVLVIWRRADFFGLRSLTSALVEGIVFGHCVTKMYAVYVSWNAHGPSGRPRYIVLVPEPVLLEDHSPFSVTKRVTIPDSHRLSGQCWSDSLDVALSSGLNVKLRIYKSQTGSHLHTGLCCGSQHAEHS